MTERRIGHGILDALSGLPLFATAPLYRHWHQRGATDEEVPCSMPGDEIVPKAHPSTRRAPRLKARYAWEKPGIALFTLVLLDSAAFPMMRSVPKGIKVRAGRMSARLMVRLPISVGDGWR